ncbi:uncharacterized protein B0T15DRAFT_27811 [Chaetomium strumarium]|uniref:Cell wall proline rich protein n=1 Tax=Chaetomium strumarium TaxID=1170767 RepID=A0AAJ0H291_9PEZI|nr:hypothetical protein B0T15DRAFT_27811 [Chaetomium strumarium]
MATTIGPDMMIEPPSPESLDHEPALPFQRTAPMSDPSSQQLRPSTSQASPRAKPPPPNPPFVFPARPSSSSAPAPFPRVTGRRPRSAIELQSTVSKGSAEDERVVSRSPALPAFSFNPGASLPSSLERDNMFLSPPQSPSAPNSPRLTPNRPTGHRHRRGGSEFVGGSIRDGEAITVMNNSPTKLESGKPSPLLQPTTPRRGHAHRRSAAISSHDLSSIIVPPSTPNVRGSSAPTSPTVSERLSGPSLPVLDQPVETDKVPSPVPELLLDRVSGPAPVPVPVEQPSKPAARNRVGFSDTLEYIPRPLSVVSTDTSSTVRPGHSVSGSISSVISLSNADRDVNHLSGASSAPKLSDSRPSTAGAVMERTQSAQEHDPAPHSPRRRGSIPLLGSLPPTDLLNPATPSPTRSAKKWSFFGLDPFASASPTRTEAESPCSTISHLRVSEGSSTKRGAALGPLESGGNAGALKPLGKKRSKKQKKVKSWAGSILSRKGKHRHSKHKKRAPTPPPPRRFEPEDEPDDAMHMFPEPEPPVPCVTDTQSWENWTFPKASNLSDEDASYPMIDLDAALGPFNTPLPRNPEWEAAQRAGGRVKKQLHSAAGMSRFSGPGMHYHRRAESAPELAPFEAGRFGFRRFGSSSTMADVFEEDEEDEEDSASSSAGPSTPAISAPAAETPKSKMQPKEESHNACQGHVQVSGTVSSLAESKQLQFREADNASSTLASAKQEPTNVCCDDGFLGEPTAPYSAGRPSPGDENHSSATPSPRHAFRPKDLAPVEVSPLNLPTASLGPVSPWSMTQSSAFPSPRSQMSYDAHCISTAPSSITEDNFQSLLMGEPGPEVRISVDDTPSLTSSNSTMTRDSLFPQHPQARYPPLNEHPRPASFTSTSFGRRRSSLASLSRLINSSHGERSKLSIEVTLDNEPEKKAKASKTKRLSRMMQFWKSKDGSTS